MRKHLVPFTLSLITFVGLVVGSAFASAGPMPNPNGPGTSQLLSH
jgi:hypothetical protein